MKLAQAAYQRENFSGARQLFEAIAESDPLHPLAEAALFWAGRSALLTMEPTADQQAVVLWEKVVAKGGRSDAQFEHSTGCNEGDEVRQM